MGGGQLLLDYPHNRGDHAVNIAKNFIVPETQNPEALLFKKCRPALVTTDEFSVLSSINFDNKHCLKADKIDNILSERMLTAKPVPVELLVTEMLLQLCFHISRILSEVAGKLPNFCRNGHRNTQFTPHPSLPPSRGKESRGAPQAVYRPPQQPRSPPAAD